jgi:hypothetical protein
VARRGGHQRRSKDDTHLQPVRAPEHRPASGEQHPPREPSDQNANRCRRDDEEGRSWPRPDPTGQAEHTKPEERAAQQDGGTPQPELRPGLQGNRSRRRQNTISKLDWCGIHRADLS